MKILSELYDVTTTTTDSSGTELIFNFTLLGENEDEAKQLSEFAACEALRVIYVANGINTASEMSLFIDEHILFTHDVKVSEGY